jgi:hypothetical protein
MKKKIVLIILALIVFFGFFAVRAALSLKSALKTANQAVGAAKLQDLDATKSYLGDAKKQFESTQSSLKVLTPLRVIPLLGWYVADAQRGISAATSGLNAAETLTEAITPYADVLGLKGKGSFLGGTAQERLSSAIETLSKVSPKLDSVGSDLEKAKVQIDQIQTWRYPNILPTKPGEKLAMAKNSLDQIETFIVDTRPLVNVLPQIMGEDTPKTYLVLLQNDKELRPTGGFITAYAIFNVSKGKIESQGSQDIYQLDASVLKKVVPPAPITKYLNVTSFNLRDSNFSPDYLASINQFQDLYNSSTQKKNIDGIIAVDTQFVLDMIKVLGPIDAYGTKFTADKVEACGCPQIIYELERFADQPRGTESSGRKDIIAVLMQQMMAKTFAAPKSTWPNILGTMLASLKQKDVLLYFKNQDSQAAVERVNYAGRLYQYDGDYLAINEANLGGAKSNLYIEEKVSQKVEKDKDGNLHNTLTIDYKYPRAMDNCNLERKGGLCLAGIYQDYIRIYVPKGAKLIKAAGTEVPISASEDLGKTVFAGFFMVRPQGTAKIQVEYTVPIKASGKYKLLIQKQPGTSGYTYQVEAFGVKTKTIPLDSDKEFTTSI